MANRSNRNFESHINTAQNLLRVARSRYEAEARPLFKTERLVELQTMEFMVNSIRSIYENLNK